MVKLSPTLADNIIQLDQVVKVCQDYQIDGYVCTNTLPHDHPRFGRGGMSGMGVREHALRICKEIRDRVPKTTIIGCGGIDTGYQAMRFKQNGADLSQSYAGFVVGPLAGPQFAHKINQDFERRINDEILYAHRSTCAPSRD